MWTMMPCHSQSSIPARLPGPTPALRCLATPIDIRPVATAAPRSGSTASLDSGKPRFGYALESAMQASHNAAADRIQNPAAPTTRAPHTTFNATCQPHPTSTVPKPIRACGLSMSRSRRANCLTRCSFRCATCLAASASRSACCTALCRLSSASRSASWSVSVDRASLQASSAVRRLSHVCSLW